MFSKLKRFLNLLFIAMVCCFTFVVVGTFLVGKFDLLPINQKYPQEDGWGPRLYQGICSSYAPSRDWMHAWLEPIDASLDGWTKNSLKSELMKRFNQEDSAILDFYVSIDLSKPLLNMPTLDKPSLPSGFLTVRTVAQGKKDRLLDRGKNIRLVKKEPKFDSVKYFDLDPDRYKYYSCGFHAVKPIDWCVTDNPYGMTVPIQADQCEAIQVPLGEQVDVEKNLGEIERLKTEGWIQEF